MPIIFKNIDFLFVWLGQVLSQAGTRMYQIAIIWWILTEMNGGGSEIAFFMVTLSLPSLLFVKRIGHIIEQTSSKKVFLISELFGFLTILCVVVLIYNSKFTVFFALLAGFLLAVFQAFIDPTLLKSVPELCEEQDTTSAVAFISSTQALSNFAGAILGAFLIELIGLFGVTIINGVSYVLCVALLLFVKFRNRRTEEDRQLDMIKPWHLLKKMPLIKKMLFGFGFANFFLNPILIIMPMYTQKILNENASILGTLEGAMWVGLLIGGFTSKLIRILDNNPIKIVMFILLLMGITLSSTGIIISTFFFIGILFFIGVMLGVMNVKIIDYFQKNVLEEYRGRFFAILQAVITFSFPVAYFLFGHMAEFIRINYLCIIQGIGLFLVGIYFYFLNQGMKAEV